MSEKKINPACPGCDNYIGNKEFSGKKFFKDSDYCQGDFKNSFYYPNDCPGWESEAEEQKAIDAQAEMMEQWAQEYEEWVDNGPEDFDWEDENYW